MSQSLERGLYILELIGSQPRSITELSVKLEVHPTTALRLVHDLRKWHFVQILPDGNYGLGPVLIGLGHEAIRTNDLRLRARPFLLALNEETTETVHLAALDMLDIMYVDKVEARHAVRIESHVGRVVLKHCTGVGKAVLSCLTEAQRAEHYAGMDFRRYTSKTITDRAELDRDLALTRERGYAVDDEEHEQEICCAAVPIFSATGVVAGSVSVTAPVSRLPLSHLVEYLPQIQRAAEGISGVLGYSEPT